MAIRKSFCINRLRAQDVIAELPTLQTYDASLKQVDVLVVAAGFEPRVLAAPRELASKGLKVGYATLIADYQTNVSDNLEQFAELDPLLGALCSPMTLHFDAEDPTQTGQSVAAAIAEVPEGQVRVAFDISGASSTLILSVMAALVGQSRPIHLTLLYATAATYDPPPGAGLEVDRPELRLQSDGAREQGVSRVSHNELCAGLHHDHLPAMVIALPSMYSERLESCLSHLNVGPMTGSQDNLYWILPSTQTQEHVWRQQAARASVEKLIHKYEGHDASVSAEGLLAEDQLATCDVSSYQHCLELIVQKVDQYPGRNISVVHMGTKLQAIGVALAVAARQEVAVVTARPTGFNAKSYSDGIGTLHQLVFEDLARVVASVTKIGCLEVDA